MVRDLEMELFIIKTEIFIWDNGKRVKKAGKGLMNIKIQEKNWWVFLKTEILSKVNGI